MDFPSNNAKEPECDHWKAAGDFFSSVFHNNRKDTSKENPTESSSSGQSIDECNRLSKKGNLQKDGASTKMPKSECDHWKTAGEALSSFFSGNQNDVTKKNLMEPSSSSPSIDKCDRSPKEDDFQKDRACTKISKPECDNWKKAVEMFFSSFDNNQNDMTKKSLMELSSSSPSIDDCNQSPKEGGVVKDGTCIKLSKPECNHWKTAVESLSSFFNNGKNEMTEKNPMESSSSRPSLDQFYQSLRDLQKDGELSKSECDHWKKTVEALSSFFNNNENDMTTKNSMKSSPSVDKYKRSLKKGDLQKDGACTKIGKPKIDHWKTAVDTLSCFFDNNENDMTEKNLTEFSSSSASFDECNGSLKEGDLQKYGSCAHIDSNKKQNLLVSSKHNYGDLKKKSTVLLEEFYVSDEYVNETACKGENMKDEWSQDEEDLLWSHIEPLRERNAVTSETFMSHVRACRKSRTSVCFGSFVQETDTTELLDYSSSSYASSIHSFENNKSFSNCAA